MRTKYFIFIIKGIVPGVSGRPTVIGRCGDFPIRVHDKFERIFLYKPREGPMAASRAPIRDVEREVSLRVVCAHAYERSLPELGEGMTGSLVLEGEGIDLVAPGWILGSIDDRPPRGSQAERNPAEESVVG